MREKYCPKEIEQHVQNYWDKNQTFKVTEDKKKKKYYCLVMLPYPSGKLHMGHVRNYTIGDVIARYQRMLGKNVLHPIGWDAFGLPAENAALENNTDPYVWTKKNIDCMRMQLKSLGFSYDWTRELTTCHPQYYRWEQWFFIELYKKGLAYKKLSTVNWCSKDKTVLANEQVINNRCWRCDSIIEKKKILQWFLKITAYADQLLNDLNQLKYWPKKIINMQRNWIGRMQGIEIIFRIKDKRKKNIHVFTKSPEIIMGVTYLVISTDHDLIDTLLNNKKILNFISQYKNYNLEKPTLHSGIDSGLFAEHPITNELLPIWISNFILKEYKTHAMMAVPAHSQSDLNFANKYQLKIKPILLKKNSEKPTIQDIAMTYKGTLFNSGIFSGLSYKDSIKVITNFLEKNRIGIKKTHYYLQDWGVSRQRYWGTPIPMLTLSNGDIIPEKEEHLPIVLQKNQISKKIYIKNKEAIREKDTLDTFIESSWYYARYTCPFYEKGMLKNSSVNYWLPVDQYVGGIEHAILHLMYFRFFHKLLRDFGLVNSDEPVKRLLCQGMVLSDTFYTEENGKKKWLSYKNVHVKRDQNGNIIKEFDSQGKKVIYAGLKKMSKSKKNGIDPQTIIDYYGSDTLRLFIMFAAPANLPLVWNIDNIKGIHRFLKKIWKLVFHHVQEENFSKIVINYDKLNYIQKEIRYFLHKTILKVSDDMDRRQTFNTAISSIMKMTNKLILFPQKNIQDRMLMQEALIAIIQMLYPFTPHISFICWKALKCVGEIDYATWPKVDYSAIIKDKLLLMIQVNGKLRGKIYVTKKDTKEEIQKVIIKNNYIEKYLKNKKVLKIFYRSGKIINFVTN